MKKSSWVLVAAGIMSAATIAILAVPPVRWRLHLLVLTASGQIQDFSWGEMAHMMRRHSQLDSRAIFKTRDPYSAIFAPTATPENWALIRARRSWSSG